MALDAQELEEIARHALANGDEEAALAQIAPAAEEADNPRLWQYVGLLQRSLDRHETAIPSFTAAALIAPGDAGIAHGLARVTLEAGLDAVALFERAAELAPSNGAVLLGLVSAKFAAGRGPEAEVQLEAALERSPLWIEGHIQLAQLRSMVGVRDRSTDSIERALRTRPGEPRLWTALFDLAVSASDFAALDDAVARARRAGMAESMLLPFEAIAASEQGHAARADELYEKIATDVRKTISVWHVRHLLRAGRVHEAIALIDRNLEGDQAAQFWPYAAIAWRSAGDPRSQWLEAGGQLVSTFDLRDQLPSLDELAARLRSLHLANGEHLDQSVRGGTQTDGPLLSRIDPEIRGLRAAIVKAVQQYQAGLQPDDPAHPLLRERRGRRIRFAGSWSVRLQGSGFHVNHVHPQGWISSALYVATPAVSKREPPNAGWLKIGEAPPELGVNAPGIRMIEPKPGRLVLFPSWMWHGTTPFAQGERLTVAFDVRSPI